MPFRRDETLVFFMMNRGNRRAMIAIASAAMITGMVIAPMAAAQQNRQPGAQESTQRATPHSLHQNPPADTLVSPAGMTPAGYAGTLQAIGADSVHALRFVMNGHLVMRHDSVRIVTDSLARVWFAALHDVPVNRYQQLPMAIIAAYKGDDAEVQRRIEAVLSTPGLPAKERAWALGYGVHIILETDTIATVSRIAIARGYLAKLADMPFEVSAIEQFHSLVSLMQASATLGNADQAIRDGLTAFGLAAKTNDYEIRASIARSKAVIALALLLSGQPNGTARIDSLSAALKRYITLSQASADADPALRRLEEEARKDFDANIKKVSYLGKPAAPFVATHWFNQPVPTATSSAAPDARIKPLDDGIIRIIGMGWFTCPWCQKEMHEFKRMQPLLPKGVQLLYYETIMGNWGGNFVSPSEEAEHLRHYNIDRKKYTYPFAIWAGPKDSTPDGGSLPRVSPMLAAYAFNAGPTIIVVDGHGIVRNYSEGYEVYEESLKDVIEQLVRERDHPGERFIPSGRPVNNANSSNR